MFWRTSPTGIVTRFLPMDPAVQARRNRDGEPMYIIEKESLMEIPLFFYRFQILFGQVQPGKIIN